MHGFNNGAAMLQDLMMNYNVLAIQEHWLRDDELQKFSLLNSNYNYCSVSAMTARLEQSILRGRPFGGVAFLWNKSINSNVQYIGCDSMNRCVAIKLSTANRVVIIFNVHFPCHSDTAAYRNDICMLVGYMEDVVQHTSWTDIIILGDFNFNLDPSN